MQKILTFFQQKITVDLIYLRFKFNETLTNDVVNFEQLAPGVRSTGPWCPVWHLASAVVHYKQK